MSAARCVTPVSDPRVCGSVRASPCCVICVSDVCCIRERLNMMYAGASYDVWRMTYDVFLMHDDV
eukprot:1635753-Pyramimonas_sp.AAC.2